METQLKNLLGRQIDLVSKIAVERSHNWIRRQNILDVAEILYCSNIRF